MKKSKGKANKGITLIALVITIIVLLILAGISIATLNGENGVLTKANTAKEESKITEYKEEINLIIIDEMSERKIENKSEAMIVSLTNKIKEKQWVKTINQYNEEEMTEEEPENNRYLIIESQEGYEFIIEVDKEKETAQISQANKVGGKKYTITYHPNGGTGEEKTVEVREGFYKILETNTFTKSDYIFGGWSEKREADGETIIYSEGSKYKPEGNVTLYAIWETPPITAESIKKEPKRYYGSVVTNYTCQKSEAVENWLIFYAGAVGDRTENNIYLIAEDYIHKDFVPNGKSGTAVERRQYGVLNYIKFL